jgi:2-dehydropantoate 2-reductase
MRGLSRLTSRTVPSAAASGPRRVLVLGAGVIGSVYAGKLIQAGHRVVMLARGRRLADLQTHGLLLQDAESGHRTQLPVLADDTHGVGGRYDLVLVSVRAEQLPATLPILAAVTGDCDVLFFGNAAGRSRVLTEALGDRALLGFPAAAGVREGPLIRYMLIRQQKTTLGEPGGAPSPRARRLQAVFRGAGFPTAISANMDGWLMGHAAFVVPIAFALYRDGADAARLASDPGTVRLMVRATRQAFQALRAAGAAEIPGNLNVLYLWMPEAFTIRYWQRVLAGPRGELWFAAHSRAAHEEMTILGQELQAAVRHTGRSAPALDTLLPPAGTRREPR